VPKAAVGQDAVDVEGHEAHLAGALDHRRRYLCQNERFGGMGRSNVGSHGQITLAASRSCMCRAPNNSPSSSTTRSWVRRLSFMKVAASTASDAGETLLG